MGKPVKTHRKQKFNYNKNRKRAWRKSKKMPTIGCEAIKGAWDEKKTVDRNMREMGLSSDPNKTIAIPKAKSFLGPKTNDESTSDILHQAMDLDKHHVAEELERQANLPQERRLRLSNPDVQYAIYMIEKYGEDYKAMARDHKNYYQDTPKQIRKKIMKFRSIPEQYNAYVVAKEKGEKLTVDDDDDV